jgi:hypothetical protein
MKQLIQIFQQNWVENAPHELISIIDWLKQFSVLTLRQGGLRLKLVLTLRSIYKIPRKAIWSPTPLLCCMIS